MEKILLNKKGNVVVSLIIIAFTIFTVAIATLTLQKPLDEITQDILNDASSTEEAKQIIDSQQQNFQTSWDGMIVFIFAMLWLFGLISSFFIDSHPVFFILGLLMILIAFYVLGILGNEFLVFISDPDISNYAQEDYPMTLFLMSYIVEIGIIMGFSFMVALYAKFRSGGF
jgi:hypothetical protein